MCSSNIADEEGFIYTCSRPLGHKGEHRHNGGTLATSMRWTTSHNYPRPHKPGNWINSQATAVVTIFVLPTVLFLLLALYLHP